MSENKEKEVKQVEEVKPVEAKTEVILEDEEAGPEIIETTKAMSWWNRIWSAIVGVILGILSTFGITQDQVAVQKENVKEMKQYVQEAIASLKNGEYKKANEWLIEASKVGKEVATSTKDMVEKVKAGVSEQKTETKPTEQKTETKK